MPNCRTTCRPFQSKRPRHDSMPDARPTASDTDIQFAMAEYAMYFGDDSPGRFIDDSTRTQWTGPRRFSLANTILPVLKQAARSVRQPCELSFASMLRACAFQTVM